MKFKKVLCFSAIIIILLIMLCPWIISFLISLRDIYAGVDFMSAPFTGMYNYKDFWASDEFIGILKNSGLLSLSCAVLGALYTFLSFHALGAVKKTVLKASLAFVLVLPAAVPSDLYPMIIFGIFSNPATFLQLLITGVLCGIRFAALTVIPAIFIRRSNTAAAIKLSLLLAVTVFAAPLAAMPMQSVINLVNTEKLDMVFTFPSFIYYAGRVDGNYGYSAAVEISQLIVCILPVIVFGALLMLFPKKTSIRKNQINMTPFMATAIIPLLVFISALIVCGKGEWVSDSRIFKSVLIGIFTSAASMLLIIVLSLTVARLLSEFKKTGVMLGLLMCMLSECIIGKFHFIRYIGLFDSNLAAIIGSLHIVPIFAMVLLILLNDDYFSPRKIIPVVTASAGIIFALNWGNSSQAIINIIDINKFPVSLLMYRIMLNDESKISMLPYILIPVLAVGICIFTGTFLNAKSEKTE